MDSLSAFVNDVSSFQIAIPLWIKIGIILVLIISLIIGGYFIKDTFDISYLKGGFSWFIFIAVINLTSILLIFYYYGANTGKYVGAQGKRGKKGKLGKVGSSTTCTYNCKTNIYIQSVRKTDIICTLNTYSDDFKTINNKYKYFTNLIKQGNNIDYGSFLNNIINKSGAPVSAKSTISQDAVNKFNSLLSPTAIAILLVKSINDDITNAAERTYGTFRSPVPKVGYIPLGDCAYGGTETFELNSFVVSGNVMYPIGYNKLLSFTSYNEITEDYDKYTLWTQISQTVNDPTFGGGTEQHSFLPLGDVCSFGNQHPLLSNYAMLKDDCLEPVKSLDLKLIFIYVGNLEFNDTTSNITAQGLDYTQTDSYLIKNKVANDIEIFSVWRTPMNTFLTNCNSQNQLVNNTVIFNILNNIYDALNDYGNISNEYKKWVNEILQIIEVPQFIIAMIYTKHFEIEYYKELIYYINKYQAQVPEFKKYIQSHSRNAQDTQDTQDQPETLESRFGSKNRASAAFSQALGAMQLGELLNMVNTTQTAYDNFNKELIKNASISLRATKAILYNEKAEKHLPPMIIQITKNITNGLATLPIQIENSSNLLDVINIIIPNGLQGRIAVDSDGIAEGGILLNEIQEMVVRLCKIIFPPNRPAYTIKDECLGTFAIDREREQKIQDLTTEKDIYNKFIDDITTNYDKYQSQLPTIRNYEDLATNKMGQLCGHIQNYMRKIHDLDLEEFTTNRIKGLTNIYKETNSYLANIIKNTP